MRTTPRPSPTRRQLSTPRHLEHEFAAAQDAGVAGEGLAADVPSTRTMRSVLFCQSSGIVTVIAAGNETPIIAAQADFSKIDADMWK